MAKRVLTKLIFCGTGITKNGNDRPTRFVMTAFIFYLFIGTFFSLKTFKSFSNNLYVNFSTLFKVNNILLIKQIICNLIYNNNIWYNIYGITVQFL
jgi:hypothetical protein